MQHVVLQEVDAFGNYIKKLEGKDLQTPRRTSL